MQFDSYDRFTNTLQNTHTGICMQMNTHGHLNTHTVSSTFMNNSEESFLRPNSCMGFFVLFQEDFFFFLFSPSFSYSVPFPAALLSHSSTSHFEPTLEVSGFYSWFTLAPPFYAHPSFSLSLHPFSPPLSPSTSSSSTSCWPLPVVAGRGGFNEQRGVGWFSLTHVMSPTSFIPNSYVPSSPSLSFSSLPRSLIPFFFCVNSLHLPLQLPLLNYYPTTTSSSNNYSSLSDA